MKAGVLFRHFPWFFKAVSKQYIARWKILFPVIFSKFGNFVKICDFSQSLWRHKVKIELKRGQICILYSAVIKRSNWRIVFFSRLVIYFWDQFFKIVILWSIHRSDVILKLGVKRDPNLYTWYYYGKKVNTHR